MESSKCRKSAKLEALTLLLVALIQFFCTINAQQPGEDGWESAHATFYGDMTGNDTMQGACGYGDLFQQGYGLETTALSVALFNDGRACGGCYQIMCYNTTWCVQKNNAPLSIHVTATNLCPANYSKPNENWCNPPLKHFDLSQPMFRTIAEYKAGIVPVLYRRVQCAKKGGIKFEIKGNPWWISVLVYNVGGVGVVKDVKVKGSNTSSWLPMDRKWGQIWVTEARLVGQGMSFQVTTTDGKMAQSDNVVPSNWKFGDNYEGKQIK
ncbi:expansin-A23-like [Silene latifolia]|uniref:expansin-A23-like n=1 Tax=Silene latifolia TaxID=37657 RepID=UPI003D784563